MFKLSEIKELIKLIDSTSIQQIQIENDNWKLSIRKPDLPQSGVSPVAYVPAPSQPPEAAAPVSAPAVPAASQDLHTIVSPMVGTFYSAPSPDAAPFVKAGDHVSEKTVVCIVEAMKLMNEIEAEVSGQIVEVLVENGQLVEFGQPLFLVKR